MYQYDEVQARFYDHDSLGIAGDVEFYVQEARKAEPPVLELACGTGRITIPIAEAGVDVIGLDLSRQMLGVARKKVAALSPEVQSRIQLQEGDMRDFSLGRKFQLIMIPYRAFLHLETTQDQRAALSRMREHLTDGGRLIFNVFDPRLDIINHHMNTLQGAPVMSQDTIGQDTGHRVVKWNSLNYDPLNQRVVFCVIRDVLDDNGLMISRTYVPLSARWVYRYEMEHLLELCGFKVDALYGDFNRSPFRYGGEQVWVCRKA